MGNSNVISLRDFQADRQKKSSGIDDIRSYIQNMLEDDFGSFQAQNIYDTYKISRTVYKNYILKFLGKLEGGVEFNLDIFLELYFISHDNSQICELSQGKIFSGFWEEEFVKSFLFSLKVNGGKYYESHEIYKLCMFLKSMKKVWKFKKVYEDMESRYQNILKILNFAGEGSGDIIIDFKFFESNLKDEPKIYGEIELQKLFIIFEGLRKLVQKNQNIVFELSELIEKLQTLTEEKKVDINFDFYYFLYIKFDDLNKKYLILLSQINQFTDFLSKK